MGRAFELPKDAACGDCKAAIKEGDIYTIIYEDDNSGKIKMLQCDKCEVDDRIAFYRKTGEVGSRLSIDAALAHYHLKESDLGEEKSLEGLRKDVAHFYKKYKKDLLEIHGAAEKTHELIRQFEAKHWLPYLKKYYIDADMRGHEAKVGKVKVLMWGIAGRVMLTLSRGDDDISLIFTDEESQTTPNGGQQGINCSHKSAQEMIQTLIDAKKIEFKVNKEVKMAGL